MTYAEFKECFQPLAELGFSTEKLPGALDVYYKSLKELDAAFFRLACLRIADRDDISLFGRFPSPVRFRHITMEEWKARNTNPIDYRIGNRPQDIQAQAEFYETVRMLGEKHRNNAPESFITPLFGIYENCARELHRMDTHHKLHGKEKQWTKEPNLPYGDL